jgi:hypothetical protein
MKEIQTAVILVGGSAHMPVAKFVCEVVYASGFASSMDGDVPWDTRSIVWKARLNYITLEKGN